MCETMLLMQPAVFASLVQSLGDLVVIMLVVGLALHGWQQGLFQATLSGLQVLGSFFAALFLADLVEPLVSQAGIEDRHAFAVAFLAVFLGAMLVIRLVAWAAMRGTQVRLASFLDRVGGAVTGAIAGYALAGAVLVAWSMAPVPATFELAGARLRLDAGTPLLRAAARSVREEDLGERLVRCYETGDWEKRRPPIESTPEAGPPDAESPEPAAGPDVSPQP
ncbi:MAG: CvpA family protein [Planctomycetia bacterium]